MVAEQTAFLNGNGDDQKTMVVVFLRGGADGLNMVAPLEDDGYYRARPRIAISKENAVKLDGFFGLNPLLGDLEPAYKDGALALVHAVGSEDTTRSHFEAQDLMEHGGLAAGGWLGRFLRSSRGTADSPLSAVAIGKTVPECLRGAPSAAVMESLADFSLGAGHDGLTRELARLYRAETGLLGDAGDTFQAMQRIEELSTGDHRPEHGAEYAGDDFARAMRQIAQLTRARVGLVAATVDLNGWDSHFAQGPLMDPLMTRLSKGLAAFYQDMGEAMMKNITVVVMTEFGRRLRENSAFGTDHGRGSVMFMLGGGIKGGRVLGQWPGLSDEVLEGPGDLPVTTNYRDVLAPVLRHHGADEDLGLVFPNHKLTPFELYGA